MVEELTPRAQAKANQVRRAAQKLFLAHGVDATSMDAITAEAGVSKQTVYSYFPSKEALVSDVLNGLVAQHAQTWDLDRPSKQELDSWTSLERELLELANRVVKALMEPKFLATIRLIVSETGSNPEYGELFRKSVAGPALKAVNAVMAGAAEDGVLAEPVHEDMSRMLVGSLLTFVLLDGLFKPEDIKRPSPRRLRRLVAFFISALQTSAESPVPS